MSTSTTCPTCGQALPAGDAALNPRMTGEFALPSPAQLAAIAAETGQQPIGAAPVAALPHAGADVCSWCGKSSTAVKKLLTGPGVQICNECVRLCHMILRDELPDFA